MGVDARTARDINDYVGRVLDGAGQLAPPVQIESVLAHLQIDRTFYDLTDPGLLRRFEHRLRVGQHQLIALIRRKVKLAAVWLPDEDRMLVDGALPDPKKRWASFHDATHRILPWHREMYLGDTAQTLDPGYQQVLEEEANYGGSALMFAGPHFTREALDTAAAWKTVPRLAKRYGASLTTTLRRYVEHGPDRALVAIVSSPPWELLPEGQPTYHRHVVCSARFAREFGRTPAAVLGALVERHVSYRHGGMVGDDTCSLVDDREQAHEFRLETFYNKYDCLTLLSHQRPRDAAHVCVPGRAAAA